MHYLATLFALFALSSPPYLHNGNLKQINALLKKISARSNKIKAFSQLVQDGTLQIFNTLENICSRKKSSLTGKSQVEPDSSPETQKDPTVHRNISIRPNRTYESRTGPPEPNFRIVKRMNPTPYVICENMDRHEYLFIYVHVCAYHFISIHICVYIYICII